MYYNNSKTRIVIAKYLLKQKVRYKLDLNTFNMFDA